MTHSSEFIILWSTKVGEKSVVLHTLSPAWGRRSFITAASRSMALYQPLSIIDAEVTENPRSDLWRLQKASASHPLNGLRTDIRKSSIAMFMSEVLFRVLKDGSYEEGLFEWCKASILTLDALGISFANYHLRFLMELSSQLGFCPSETDLMPFAEENLGRICALLKLPFAESLLYPLTGEQRGEIAECLIRYISYHTESQIQIRSLGVLKELYGKERT